MRKGYLCAILILLASASSAQWRAVPLNYKHIKRPEFFIPLSMHFSDSSNGYMLTTGSLLQMQNNHWVPLNTGDPAAFLYSNIFTVSPRHTFLCGYDGKVSMYNGDSLAVLFTLDESEAENITLNTIFMTDSLHGWAAGESGTIVKIEGITHTMHNMLPMYSFRDMYFDSPEHGWMIGYVQEFADDGGIVFEYKDGFWDVHSAVDGRVYDMEFSSPGHGFISTAENIYQYNSEDDEWEELDIPGYLPQNHLSMLNDEYGISVSDNNQNMIYDSGEWLPGPAASVPDLAGVHVTGYGTAWAISQIGNNNPQDFNEGKIQLLQGNAWSSFSIKYLDSLQTLPLDVAVTNIIALDKNNVWIDGGHINIPQGQYWPDSVPVLNSDTFCTTLKIFSDSFGLGLNGDLLQWNGKHWLNKNIDPVANPDTSVANVCMYVFDDTTGFVCRQLFAWSSGEINNVISHYNYQSNSLSVAAVIGSRYPSSIHFADKQNGWCVGDSGLLVQYDKDYWNVLPPFTNKKLNNVFTVDSSRAWVVGEGGLVYKYNGMAWEQELLPTLQNLRSVYFTDSVHGWIAGDSGLIFRYNGSAWVQDTTGTTSTLYTIFMYDSTLGFVGGDNGLVLQYVPPVPPAPPVRKFCEYGNTWFVYHPQGSGYTYQWQVDTGNGFENLTGSLIYSGIDEDTLWLSSIQPEFYGYKFRCVATVNGIDSVSESEELKLVNHWIGSVSREWENPGNWSCGSIPGENTDVIIERGEIVLRSTAGIRSLAVMQGVHIIIEEGGALNILK